MATRGKLSLTMKDWAARTDAKGDIASQRDIVEILNEQSAVVDDAMFMEANGPTHHRTVIRTGLPEAYWRTLNRGVPTGKSTTTQVDDRMGMLETWSSVDRDLVELNAQKADFMLSEESAFIEAMGQEAAKNIFYGDLQDNPAGFLGLLPRYSTLDTSKAASAENVINYGGTNAATAASVVLAVWGDMTLHMIYPKGSKLGLQREIQNGGQPMPILDEDGKEFVGYKTHYQWKMGLTLRDWRYCGRICNIDTGELNAMVQNGAAASGVNKLYRHMIDLYNRIPNVNKGRPVWYMPRDIITMLDMIAAEKSNVNLTIGEFEGKKVTMFKGIPVKREDALEIGEALVA